MQNYNFNFCVFIISSTNIVLKSFPSFFILYVILYKFYTVKRCNLFLGLYMTNIYKKYGVK